MSGLLLALCAMALVGCRDEKREVRKSPFAARPNAAEHKSCRAHCSIGGRCGHRDPGGCYARSDADCQQADVCKTSGLCSAIEGLCLGTSEEACRRSEQCSESGRCTFGGATQEPCFVASSTDCAGSRACRVDGLCSLGNDENGRAACRALSDDDCKKGTTCTENKACKAQQGHCQ